MAKIELNNVSYSYKSDNQVTRGVKNVNLQFEEGSFTVLLGHNGSGKSTLAKLLNGFLTPDEGDVFVDGINTKDEKNIYNIRSKVGMVFQNPDNQMVASIIEDDLAFGPENLGIERNEIERRITWALETVGMSEHRKRTPLKLSGGQKQRIAIAAILAMLPEVIILDESTAMLDPQGRNEVLDTVKKLNKENNMSVILITHYMDEALDADKVVVLNEGNVVLQGTPREVFFEDAKIRESGLELPIATKIALMLKNAGYNISLPLRDEELVEEICRLK